MNPTVINLRSHHSLKNSVIFENSQTCHLNPVSTRLGLAKKSSLNHKQDNSLKNQHHSRYESYNQLRYSHNAPSSLKNKDELEKKISEITDKVEKMQKIIESQESRLQNIQKKEKKQWEDISNFLLLQTSKQNQNYEETIDTPKFFHSKALPNFNTVKIQEENIKLTEKTNISSNFNTAKIQEEIQKIRTEFTQKIDSITQKWTILTDLQKQLSSIKDRLVKTLPYNIPLPSSNKINTNLTNLISPLFNKPTMRLKFLNIVSLTDTQLQNPQQQIELESQLLIYKIDEEGNLFDQNNQHILDLKNQPIQLSRQQLKLLSQINILK